MTMQAGLYLRHSSSVGAAFSKDSSPTIGSRSRASALECARFASIRALSTACSTSPRSTRPSTYCMRSKNEPERRRNTTWSWPEAVFERCSLEERCAMARQKRNIRIRRGSTNVFRDLGFPPGEAAHLKIRSDLMIEVQKAISSKGLKQAEAAKLLRVSQPRISDLLRGRIDLFSTDTLIDISAPPGLPVRLSHR